MSLDTTTVNPASPLTGRNKEPKEPPIFDEPISADVPRRQFDRRIMESYDADHERIRTISSRLTRIESVFEQLTKDLSRLEKQQGEMLIHLEQTANSMGAISNKLSVHTEMEEYQWVVVNKANETLNRVGSALNEHLQLAGGINTRIDWIERLLFLLYGGIGTLLTIYLTNLLSGG